jgi:hypothetical protein
VWQRLNTLSNNGLGEEMERRAWIHFIDFAFHERISGGNTEIEKNKQQLVTRADKNASGRRDLP